MSQTGAANLFQTKREQLEPGSAKYMLRIMLAPICLLLVAGLHWYRVEFRDQSAWKGGGFGMFSTIDSPVARSLRCYLITATGEVPVEPPQRLEKWISEMRVAPADETLPVIAERLEEATWVRGGGRWRGSEQAEASAAQQHAATEDGKSRGISALSIDEPLSPHAEVVEVLGVRLELWRYEFDRSTRTLTNTKLRDFVHRPESATEDRNQ